VWIDDVGQQIKQQRRKKLHTIGRKRATKSYSRRSKEEFLFLLCFIYMQEPHLICAVVPVAFTSINEEKDVHIFVPFVCLISHTFSNNEQCFSLIINRRTVFSALIFQPSKHYAWPHISGCFSAKLRTSSHGIKDKLTTGKIGLDPVLRSR
jgi:hypothetical protein